MANKILNLDLAKEPKLNPIIYGRVGDQDMQTVTVNTTRRDEQINLSGYTVTFEGVTGGNTKIFDVAGIDGTDLAKGTLKYTFPNMAFAAEGKYKRAYFSFVKNGKRDTTGDFTIIVLNDADIDADEAETIITEYNKLVEKLNQAYEAAIDQMNKDYEVVQEKIIGIMAELSALKIKIEAYQKSVEKTADEAIYKISTATSEALAAVADAITKLESADVIDKADLQNYLIGGKLSANHTSDLKNKVPGSDVENPHFIGKRQNLTALNPPTGNWTELDPYEINSVSALDNNLYTVRSDKKDETVQVVIKWDLIKDIKRRNPDVFDLCGATTPEQKVAMSRRLTTNLVPSLYGYGSGASGNKLTLSVYDGKSWVGSTANSTGAIKKITYTDWNKPSSINRFINDDGFIYLIAYAPASDGATPSVVNIDYVSLDYTNEISTSDLYASKSEFKTFTERRDNPHEVNAEQANAVGLTGNEDISGVKNFTGSLQYKGKDIVSDSGWIDLKWATNFGNHSSSVANKPRIRMKNGTVNLVGIGTPTVAIPKEVYDYPFITGIPNEMLPDVPYVGTLSQGSGKAIFHVKLIATNGTVQIERYRDGTGFLAIPTGNYLPVNLTWLV